MPVTNMDMYERENLQQDAMKELVIMIVHDVLEDQILMYVLTDTGFKP